MNFCIQSKGDLKKILRFTPMNYFWASAYSAVPQPSLQTPYEPFVGSESYTASEEFLEEIYGNVVVRKLYASDIREANMTIFN
jgi:hypothetical protein